MPEMSQSEIDALGGFRLIAQKYGGTPNGILQKIEDLEADNRKYRQEEKPALEARLPKDGEVVLPKSRAVLLEEYEALGKPSEIKTKPQTGEEAAGRLSELELRSSAAQYVRAAGLAEEAVDTLVAIPALKGAKFEVRKVKNEKGDEVEQAFVTLPGGETVAHSAALDKVPALKGLRTVEPTTERKKFVPQNGKEETNSNNAPKSALEAALEKNRQRASAPNPLRPAAL